MAGEGQSPQQTSIVTCHGAEQYSDCRVRAVMGSKPESTLSEGRQETHVADGTNGAEGVFCGAHGCGWSLARVEEKEVEAKVLR